MDSKAKSLDSKAKIWIMRIKIIRVFKTRTQLQIIGQTLMDNLTGITEIPEITLVNHLIEIKLWRLNVKDMYVISFERNPKMLFVASVNVMAQKSYFCGYGHVASVCRSSVAMVSNDGVEETLLPTIGSCHWRLRAKNEYERGQPWKQWYATFESLLSDYKHARRRNQIGRD